MKPSLLVLGTFFLTGISSIATAEAQIDPLLPLTVKNATVSFQSNTLQFRSGPPAVQLALGTSGTNSLELAPSGEGSVSKAECQTPMGPAEAQTWKWQDPRGYAFTWTVARLAKSPGFTMKMTFSNQSRETVRLRKMSLCTKGSGTLRVTGVPADWFLSTVDSHDSASGGMHPSGDLATDSARSFRDMLTLYSERGAKGLVMGAVGPAESDILIECAVKGGKVAVQVDSEMSDIVVDPGESRRSEEVLVLAAPYETAVTNLYRWIAATHGARTKRGPIYGWCSWYTKFTNVNEKNIDGALGAIAAYRDRMPMQVFQLDDGWQRCYGDWTADPKKFPNGMKPIAEKIAAAGMMPGIWMCLVRSSTNGVHPDGKPDEYLDPTFPATREFIKKTLHERYAEGFRYFKLDFNWARWKDRYNQKLTRLQVQRELFKLYRECIGEDAYLCACVGGFHRGCLGYADSSRIGTDSGPRWKPMYTGCSMADLFNAIGSMALTEGILFAADPDCTYTVPEKYDRQSMGRGKFEATPYLPNAVRAWHAYVGLLGSVIQTSDSFDLPPWNNDAAVRMMEILYPAAPEKGRAFDGQTDPWHRQFGLTASRSWGNFVSAIFFNPQEDAANVPIKGVPVASLGRRFHVWSFWDERYLGTADETYVATGVPACGGVLLRLTEFAKETDVPVLIGSNLHISMGAAEIQSITRKADRIQITLTDAGARAGALFFHSPKPLSVANATGCTVKTVEAAGGNVWKVSLEGRRRGQTQSIELQVAL